MIPTVGSLLFALGSRLGLAERTYGGKRRHPRWRKLRREFLLENPKCLACGSTKKVVPHHIRPYHLFPELELSWDNLVSLCENRTMNCHLAIGHGLKWTLWNPHAVDDAWWFSLILRQIRQPMVRD